MDNTNETPVVTEEQRASVAAGQQALERIIKDARHGGLSAIIRPYITHIEEHDKLEVAAVLAAAIAAALGIGLMNKYPRTDARGFIVLTNAFCINKLCFAVGVEEKDFTALSEQAMEYIARNAKMLGLDVLTKGAFIGEPDAGSQSIH